MGNKFSECNICYTKKINNYKECNLCKNCIVCNDCLNKMEENMKKKCPMCRQENWLIEKINDNKKVFPLNNILLEKEENKNESKNDGIIECNIDIYKFFKLIRNICKAIIYFFTISVLGIMTLICITNNPNHLEVDFGIFWLSILIGLIEILICWCICCKNINLFKVIFT